MGYACCLCWSFWVISLLLESRIKFPARKMAPVFRIYLLLPAPRLHTGNNFRFLRRDNRCFSLNGNCRVRTQKLLCKCELSNVRGKWKVFYDAGGCSREQVAKPSKILGSPWPGVKQALVTTASAQILGGVGGCSACVGLALSKRAGTAGINRFWQRCNERSGCTRSVLVLGSSWCLLCSFVPLCTSCSPGQGRYLVLSVFGFTSGWGCGKTSTKGCRLPPLWPCLSELLTLAPSWAKKNNVCGTEITAGNFRHRLTSYVGVKL